jgi:hypothetical protein
VIVVRVKKPIEIMENLPMLTEDEFTGIVVNLAGLLFFAGLVWWVITANIKTEKGIDEEHKKVFDDTKPIIEDLKHTTLKKLQDLPDGFNKCIPVRDVNGLTEEDRRLRKQIERTDRIMAKIALLEGSLTEAKSIGDQETIDHLRTGLNKLHMELGVMNSFDDIATTGDHTKDAFKYTFGFRANDVPVSNKDSFGPTRHFNHLGEEYYPQSGKDFIDNQFKESISDKINRLHKEMQECLPVENYERCAVIKKQLDKLYATKTSTKD